MTTTPYEFDQALADALAPRIEAAFANRALLAEQSHNDAVHEAIDALQRGALRVATPPAGDGTEWTVHAWLKRAILLYFSLRPMEPMEAGPMLFRDKIALQLPPGARLVPGAIVRRGAHVAKNVVVMPGFVNIGAFVGENTMVDTWATVGSCAQVGRDVHLAGGVGIGGVLEPPGAQPVIIEDGTFVGSRVVVVEGVRVGRESVLGAGVVLTASTTIIDVTGAEPIERKGYVPPRSVVIPGVRTKRFPAGEYGVPCALIVGKRSEATDRKVSLEQALRDFEVPV